MRASVRVCEEGVRAVVDLQVVLPCSFRGHVHRHRLSCKCSGRDRCMYACSCACARKVCVRLCVCVRDVRVQWHTRSLSQSVGSVAACIDNQQRVM